MKKFLLLAFICINAQTNFAQQKHFQLLTVIILQLENMQPLTELKCIMKPMEPGRPWY